MPTGRSGCRSVSGSRLGQPWSGLCGPGPRAGYGAAGRVVEAAAALQSAAKAGSVLVGPATKVATEGIFELGPAEEVSTQRPGQAVGRRLPGSGRKPRRPGFAGKRGPGVSPLGRPAGGAIGAR